MAPRTVLTDTDGGPDADDDRFPAYRYPWLDELAGTGTPEPVAAAASYPPTTADRDDLHLVVAVGSNASPEVLCRKLAGLPTRSDPVNHDQAARRDVEARLVRVVVDGIGIGYSAHVAHRGYIPAAPFADPGGTVTTVGAWLDETEIAALDATEPNYDRIATGSFSLYSSRHGVLAEHGSPLPFGSQDRVLTWLADRLNHPVLQGDTASVCTRLAYPSVAGGLTRTMWSAGLGADSRMTGALAGITGQAGA
ncbi:hypothetical protein GCM10009624_34550 [Gordonia sinesedis]